MMEREFKLYGFTMHYLRLLAEDVTEEQMTDIPAPGLNHPAWFIGHLAVCADFVPKLLSRPTICPPEWDALFAPGAIPTTDRSRYPSKAELLAKNEEAFVRNPKLIAEASERRLAMPHGIEYFTPLYPTIGDMIAAPHGHASGVAPRTVFDLATTARPEGRDGISVILMPESKSHA